LTPARFQQWVARWFESSYPSHQKNKKGGRTMRKIQVVLVEPGQKARIAEIDGSLEGMQQIVGGQIEAIYPFTDRVAVICNEEGKIYGLPANRGLRIDGNKELFDVVCGIFFVAGLGDENFCSLTEEQLERYKQLYLFPEKFINVDGVIKAIPYDVF
jgi:hypothetical protein